MLALRTALTSTVIAGLTCLSAGGYGNFLLRRFAFKSWTPLEKIVFTLSLGYAALSFIMIVAGAFSVWTPIGAWTILLVGWGWSAPFIKTLLSFLPFQETEHPFFTVVIAICGVWAFLIALAPITYYDSLVYHFAIPATYINVHHWLSMKKLIYPAFPQNLEMLWTMGLLLGGDTVANLISLTLTSLLLAATVAFARRWLSPREGRTALLLLAVMPAMLLLSSGGYVDAGLTLYVFLSFYALGLWWETQDKSMIILSGVLGGLAIGVKYTGGMSFAAGGILILSHDYRRPSKAIPNLFFYGLAGLAMWGPWLVKNFVYVGNPIFPFFYQWGNAKLNPWVQGAAAGYFKGLAEYHPTTPLEFIRLPWDLVVRSMRFGGGMDILGDYGWAPFVFLVPCLIFRREPLPKIVRLMLGFGALFFIPWALSRPVLRFLLPLAPVLALLAAVAWSTVILRSKPWIQRVSQGVVTILILVGFGFFFFVEGFIQSFPVALGMETRDHYLARKLNYYSAAQFVNGLPEDSVVFVVGDQRGYYYNRRVIVSPVFNQNPMAAWANQATSSKDLAAILKSQGLTHLLINRTEGTRLNQSYAIFPLNASGLKTWQDFLSSSTHLIYHDEHCDVLALS